MRTLALAGRGLDVTDVETTAALLQRWAVAHYGADAVVDNIVPMPGNAAIRFGFDVATGAHAEQLMIRVAPEALQRSGPADVLRQVPVLRATRLHGVPVPDVRWWSDDERWFASPYFVVNRLQGHSLDNWGPSAPDPSAVAGVFGQAVAGLTAVHRIDWRRRLPDWSAPRSLAEEVRAWAPQLHKSRDDRRTSHAMGLHDLLLERLPAEPEMAIVHGNFYSNNWVCDQGRLLGIVDWEFAAVGPPLFDLAWLMTMYDPQCWGPQQRAGMTWAPSPAELAAAYQESSGASLGDLAWYRGLASWRLVAAVANLVRLHREGRRDDSAVAAFDGAFETIVDRGCEFVRSGAAT